MESQKAQAAAALDAQKAQRNLAAINLGYTRIVTPVDGMVGERRVRPGQYLSVGTQVISLVPLPNVWVIANYKETQMTSLESCQDAGADQKVVHQGVDGNHAGADLAPEADTFRSGQQDAGQAHGQDLVRNAVDLAERPIRASCSWARRLGLAGLSAPWNRRSIHPTKSPSAVAHEQE